MCRCVFANGREILLALPFFAVKALTPCRLTEKTIGRVGSSLIKRDMACQIKDVIQFAD